MSDLIWLSEAQMRRIEPYFPLSHGMPRVDDRRVISGIIFVIRNGLRWRDAPKDYGPHKTIYNPSAGAGWACSSRFLQRWRPRAASQSANDRRDPFEGAPHRCQPFKMGLFPDVSGEKKAA